MKYLFISVLISVIFIKIFIDFTNDEENSQIKYENQKNMVINKKLSTLRELIADSIIKNKKYLFLYNDQDCPSCVQNGFKIIKERYIKDFIVVAQSNYINKDQFDNDFLDYIYKDEHDFIRRNLYLIKTPVFIRFNSELSVQNVYFLMYKRNVVDEKIFFIE